MPLRWGRVLTLIVVGVVVWWMADATGCLDQRSVQGPNPSPSPSPAYEAAIAEPAKRTCRMIRDRGGIAPARCETTIKRQIGELARAQGTVRRCAALQVHQVYHYVLSGKSEEIAKILAYEDMRERC